MVRRPSSHEAGIRVVHLRIPPVLGGPALQRAGFQVGDGQQWASWVGRDELAAIIEFTLTTETLAGPVPLQPQSAAQCRVCHDLDPGFKGQKWGAPCPLS